MDIITYALSKKNTGGSSGATEEQATQIQTNTNNISELKEDISSLSATIADMKETGTGVSGSSEKLLKLAKTLPIGTFFEKEDTYCGWPLGNAQYDKDIDKVVLLYNAKPAHVGGCGRVYMRTIDAVTFEVSESSLIADIVNVDGVEYGQITNTLCILKDGTYLFITKVHDKNAPDTVIEQRLHKSTDKGVTWTYTVIPCPFASWNGGFNTLKELSNGRLITTGWQSGYTFIIYSDDKGVNWTHVQTNNSGGSLEGTVVELAENKLMCIARKQMGIATTVQPAIISYSNDNGNTWSAFTDSKSIIEMNASPCSAIVHSDGIVELFYTSRLAHGDYTGGVLFKQSGTIEQALNDSFDSPVIVLGANAETGQDFGYVSSCEDAYGNIYIFYYDADSDGTNYYLIRGSRKQLTMVINDKVVGATSGFSSEKITALLKSEVAKLNKEITKLYSLMGQLPEGGGDGSLDGSMYVTDGLYEMFDFTLASAYDEETCLYTGLIAKETMKHNPQDWGGTLTDKSFDSNGLTAFGQLTNDITELVPLDSYTVEFGAYMDKEIASNAHFKMLSVTGGSSSPIAQSSGSMSLVYADASGANKWVAASGVNGSLEEGFYLYTIVSDETSIKCYRNGTLASKQVWTDIEDFASMSSALKVKPNIGSVNEGLEQKCHYKGMRIYNRPLTAEEVMNNYKYESASYQ